MMTVKELKEMLNKFDENMIVAVMGGESDCGQWAHLTVGHMETVTRTYGDKTYTWEEYEDDKVLMTDED